MVSVWPGSGSLTENGIFGVVVPAGAACVEIEPSEFVPTIVGGLFTWVTMKSKLPLTVELSTRSVTTSEIVEVPKAWRLGLSVTM